MKFHKKHSSYGDIYGDSKYLRALVNRYGIHDAFEIVLRHRREADSSQELDYCFAHIYLFRLLFENFSLLNWKAYVIHYRRYHKNYCR